MRKIKNNKKILIIMVLIVLITIYWYYQKENKYFEFEEISNLDKSEIYEETETTKEEQEKEIIVVHITGEVKKVGVYELEEGARIIDVINLAGGFTDEADTDKVNLAYILKDATKIYIPNKNEEEENITKEYILKNAGDNILTEENIVKDSNNILININKATQTELETLPGIGPSTAQKIISYREENGQFSNIEDIKNISGIGENKFKNIKELICV